MLNLKINLKRLSLPIRREYITYLDLDPLLSWALGRRTCCPTPRAGTVSSLISLMMGLKIDIL